MTTITNVAARQTIDLRCPDNIGGLLAKFRVIDGDYKAVNTDNLLEISCRNCRKSIAELTGRKPLQVLHLFDVAGRFVETELIFED